MRLGSVLVALAVVALLARDGAAQGRARPSCEVACDGAETAAVGRCAGDAACVSRARIDARRCALACDTGRSAGDRCRAECDIASDACDAGYRAISDEGERRGCLRRCGSRHHVSCRAECPD